MRFDTQYYGRDSRRYYHNDMTNGTQWQGHCTNGGTGITKFVPADRAKYEKAIAEHGDPDLFLQGNELYCLTRKDLTSFWKVFEKLNPGS